ncbi:hypothetical protein CFD26_102859 [Aspergillus turcosus]|uniref:Uncharacterized protein n=1 Tax=Aspergillus turcosus TaxID=1245748 RepID=A0A3R7LTZ6_9EURO|nr:hypothetical protein CFD26_102859 [Aspergillus turcosus]
MWIEINVPDSLISECANQRSCTSTGSVIPHDMADETGPSAVGPPTDRSAVVAVRGRPQEGAIASCTPEPHITIQTQADLLPDNPPEKLEGIPISLESFRDLTVWEFYIRNQLEVYDLECLIRADIPKPTPDHLLYEKWRKLSKKVRFWILNQLHRSVVLELIAAQEDKTYADDTFQVVTELVRGLGAPLAGTTWIRAISMKREEFGTAEEYITAFKEEVRLANELGCTITPYCASILMLEQLSRDLPHWTAAMEARFGDDAPKTTTLHYFHQLCQYAIGKAKESTRDSAPVAYRSNRHPRQQKQRLN